MSSWVRSMVDPILISGLISVSMASIIAGMSSVLITYTKTQFLALESLHIMVIASGLVGIFVSWYQPFIPSDFVSYLVMAVLALIVAMMMDRGLSQDLSIGFVVVVSSLIASISSYHIATKIPGGISYIYSLIFGNPFLLPWGVIVIYIAMGVVIYILIAAMWRSFLYMSFDPEFFEMVRGGVRLYRWILYIIIALSSIYTTRLVGAIPTLVILIIPGMASQELGSSSYIPGILFTLTSSTTAIMISYISDTPYGFTLGLTSIALYTLLILRRLRSYGDK